MKAEKKGCAMNELIKITIDGQGKQTVNARDLHEFLGSKQDFSTWIKNRINQYGFVENQDFVLLHKTVEQVSGAKHLTEYHLTIDMAKELSMVERTEKGKQARQYFIECERRAKDPMLALNDPSALRQVLLTYSEKVIALEETVQEQAPKVAALDRIATADGSMCITAAAKHLQVRPKDLFRYLAQNEWIYRRTGNTGYLGYQRRIQQGRIEHKITTISHSDGNERVYEQVRITPKGLAILSGVFEEQKIAV